MNKVVEALLERVADWPEEAQAELVRSIVDIETKHLGVYKLSPGFDDQVHRIGA